MEHDEPRHLAPARATQLGARFHDHLRDTSPFEPGDTVLAAFSGGLDSVVLLHLLRFLMPSWRFEVVGAHFDHAMRPDSAADADWVAGLCRAWGIPLERGRADRPLRSEAEARSARYRFLHGAAGRHGATRILTAHHADDQAETVLFRILRGTGTAGLAGILPRRGLVVRPLLPFRRREIEEYADAARLPHREDPTNRSLRYARNRLRLEVLPELERRSPGFIMALARLADEAREAEEAWKSVESTLLPELLMADGADGIELARPLLLSYHPYLRARLLRLLLRRYGSSLDRAGTRAALEFISSGASGTHVQVAGGIRVEREFNRIRLRPPSPSPRVDGGETTVVIGEAAAGEGEAVIGGRCHRVLWARDEAADGESEGRFDVASLVFPLEVRGWRPGDRIRLSFGTQKLKKLFLQRRVGRAERARTPVLVDGGGRVLWVVGVARAAAAEPASGFPSIRVVVEAREPAGSSLEEE